VPLLQISNLPGLDLIAPVKAPAHSEEFTLQQIGGHGRAIDLHEGRWLRATSCDEQGGDFLASAASPRMRTGMSARHQPALGFDLPHRGRL